MALSFVFPMTIPPLSSRDCIDGAFSELTEQRSLQALLHSVVLVPAMSKISLKTMRAPLRGFSKDFSK